MNNDDITLKIAEAIATNRKRSERFVGYTRFTFQFEVRRYKGISLKAEKIDVLSKTIVNLIGKGLYDKKQIGEKLGMDTNYDLENSILSDALDTLKKRYNLIDGISKSLTLTDRGKKYLEKGELQTSFSSNFELYVLPTDYSFTALRDCFEGNKHLSFTKKTQNLNSIPIQAIKVLAEQQASNVQHKKTGLELKSAAIDSWETASIVLYACFLQNVIDNSIRTIVYDEHSDDIILPLSSVIDNNNSYRDSLLKECLNKVVQDEEADIVESSDKTPEQITAEKIIIDEVEEKGDDISDDDISNRKVGSILDSAEFEKELKDIFENHNNTEIWLISPWIKDYAFLRRREPQIRRFLDDGGAIFVGYSEPERVGEEMVDKDSMSVIKRLDANYDRFYYTELPKFHFKNVIEYNSKRTILFTGSFNVLSFSINDKTENYRMEQMLIANEESAKSARDNYLHSFALNYIDELSKKMDQLQPGATLSASKLNYLKECGVIDDIYSELEKKSTEKSISINRDPLAELNKEDLYTIASKILSLPYKNDSRYIQAFLSACLYTYDYAKSKNSTKLLDLIEDKINALLARNSIYDICRFNLRKSYNDERKSVVRIICNGYNFEFGDISLRKDSFNLMFKHREIINFKEENIKLANLSIEDLLYNSSKSVL